MNLVKAPERSSIVVSVSQAKTYMMCPRKYELRYVLREEPAHRSANLVVGVAVHEALACYYVGRMAGQDAPLEQLLERLSESFAQQCDGDLPILVAGGTIKEERSLAETLVRVFHEEVARPDEVHAVEAPFAMDVVESVTGEVLVEQLIGYIDAVVDIGGETVASRPAQTRPPAPASP